MIREIIKIDEEKCDGCGICIPGCPEGALQLIDGKARLVSDLMCDGLGACIGECPLDAITIEKREAEKYNETEVIKVITKQGRNTTIAHLKHLNEHGETAYYNEAIAYLKNNQNQISFNVAELLTTMENKMPVSATVTSTSPEQKTETAHHSEGSACGCPGGATQDFRGKIANEENQVFQKQYSELRQWPIQMHLVNPMAPYFKNCDLLLAADCVAFAIGDFHRTYMKGRSIAIACPKLDSNQDIYRNKLISMINDSNINTITVMIMEVPCCGGLLQTALYAVKEAGRKVPVKMIVVGLQGDILKEDWV